MVLRCQNPYYTHIIYLHITWIASYNWTNAIFSNVEKTCLGRVTVALALDVLAFPIDGIQHLGKISVISIWPDKDQFEFEQFFFGPPLFIDVHRKKKRYA